MPPMPPDARCLHYRRAGHFHLHFIRMLAPRHDRLFFILLYFIDFARTARLFAVTRFTQQPAASRPI
jgi:hypothetical protein